MSSGFPACRVFLIALVAGALSVSASGQGPSPEAAARARYKAALAFSAAGQRREALQSFRDLVQAFPGTAAAADALVQIAFHELDVSHDLDAARAAAEAVISKYADKDAAAMAYVALGRIALARGTAPGSMEAALGHFQRVLSGVPPEAEAFPAALYGAAEALRLAGRFDEAAERYESVTIGYARSVWSARAALALASCLMRTGQVARAIAEVQRVRLRLPASPDRDRALAYSTILYRLYVLPQNRRAPFEFIASGQPAAPPIRGALAVAVSPRDVLHVVTGDAVSVFDAARAAPDIIPAPRARGVLFDPDHTFVVSRRGLQTLRGTSIPLAATDPDNQTTPLENVVAAAITSTGDLLVADGDREAIERYPGAAWTLARVGDVDTSGAAGNVPALASAPAPFAGVNVVRLAVNSLDGVAAIPEGSRSVVVFPREGGQAVPIPPRGAAYQIRNPVDLAFDALDHLYVLDRDSGTVWIFGPGLNLVTSYTLAQSAPGAFYRARALAVDAVGRLHIYDERAQRVQVYQ